MFSIPANFILLTLSKPFVFELGEVLSESWIHKQEALLIQSHFYKNFISICISSFVSLFIIFYKQRAISFFTYNYYRNVFYSGQTLSHSHTLYDFLFLIFITFERYLRHFVSVHLFIVVLDFILCAVQGYYIRYGYCSVLRRCLFCFVVVIYFFCYPSSRDFNPAFWDTCNRTDTISSLRSCL